MLPSAELLQNWIQLRLDVGLFLLAIIALYGTSLSFLRRRRKVRIFPKRTAVCIGVFSLFGVVAAEIAGDRQRTAVGEELASLAPTYSHELRALGHARV